MEPFGVRAVVTAGVICGTMAHRAVRKRSLTVPGAVAGGLAGFLLVATGLRGLLLFFFYQIGSYATRYKAAVKMTADATLVSHATRGAAQVLCVSVIAVALSLSHALACGPERPLRFVFSHHDTTENASAAGAEQQHALASRLAAAIVAHHATGLADTLASELGILSSLHQPSRRHQNNNNNNTFLITQPWRCVPPGTNGGITFAGCGWSAVGGATIGLLTIVTDTVSGLAPRSYAVPLLVYATLAGLLGSLLDSVVGAVLQATYCDDDGNADHGGSTATAAPSTRVYHANSSHRPVTAVRVTGVDVLTNEQVNLVSTALAVIAGGWFLAPFVFGAFDC